jgi:hypothetical protein
MCVGYQHEREPSVVTDAKKKSIKIDKEESCVALLIVRTSDLFLATVERTRSKNNDNKTTKK